MNDSTDKYLSPEKTAGIQEAFRNSFKRLFLLDYDGTLVPFNCDPSRALPDPELMILLRDLSEASHNDLAIISGRNRSFLEGLFSHLNVSIFAEHGAIYRVNGRWDSLDQVTAWKDEIKFIMQRATEAIPRSHIESKENSIVWHYRKSEPLAAEKKAIELIDNLTTSCDKNNLTIIKGSKIIEVKPSEYTKGTAIINFFDCSKYDFIFAAGDDTTDEDLFAALPARAYTIQVGGHSETAMYAVKNSPEFVKFLRCVIS